MMDFVSYVLLMEAFHLKHDFFLETMMILMTVFVVIAGIVEKNFDETHPVKQWWRINVIGAYPEDSKYKEQEDDNQE
jgi:hypothetical protein